MGKKNTARTFIELDLPEDVKCPYCEKQMFIGMDNWGCENICEHCSRRFRHQIIVTEKYYCARLPCICVDAPTVEKDTVCEKCEGVIEHIPF